MNRNETKLKRYSAVAIVALCAVVCSLFVMRRATNRMADELLHITAPTAELTTAVENEAGNVPDPRAALEATTTTEAPTSEPETTAATTAPTTAKAETKPAATAPTTEKPAAAEAAAAVKNDHFILPIEGAEVQKKYSPDVLLFSATMQDWRTHNGVDFSAEAGSEVRSVGNGRVSKVISDPRQGYTIEVDYGTFTARYSALSQEGAVGIDKEVHTGDVLGTLADSPLESADPPHLHFEALRGGSHIDPLEALES